MNELVTKENSLAVHLCKSMESALERIESIAASYRPVLGGERYLTDKEVAGILKLSRRTLQEHRNAGRMAYIQLGGKILYRESDIEKMLAGGYREAYHAGG